MSALEEWAEVVCLEFDVPAGSVDARVILDMARDVAHGVARPAAPLTAFLVGYAAAQAGGGPAAVAEANRKASALATSWKSEEPGA